MPQNVGVCELLQQPAEAVPALGIRLGHDVFHVRMLAKRTVSTVILIHSYNVS